MVGDSQPVIVGVGEVVGDRDRSLAAAREPLVGILQAARRAATDAGTGALLAAVDAVFAVPTASWAYEQASRQVARALAAHPRHLADPGVGGHWPARLLERAAARIAAGEGEVALLVGGEAQASLSALAKAGRDPIADAGWSRQPGGPVTFEVDELGTPRMLAAGVVLPTRVYPLFQHALQADLGLAPDQAARRSAALYARFTQIAADHPIAWAPHRRTAEDIATVRPENRMIAEPYPLAVNAMPVVDQAAAVLVTSVGAARRHGIPDDRWVHVWGGAGSTDTVDVLERRGYASSDALASAFDRALHRTGLTASDLDLLDVYSCFPVVPELVMRHLGLADEVTPTVTGGHAAFGGPLSSYSLHAIASVTRRLRAGAAHVGAVHANGGYLTHQHVTVLGAAAHPDGYVGDPDPVVVARQPELIVRDASDVVASGSVQLEIETWTVEHDRAGHPAQAFVIGRTPAGERTAVATPPGDRPSAAALSDAALPAGRTSWIGAHVTLEDGDTGPVIAL